MGIKWIGPQFQNCVAIAARVTDLSPMCTNKQRSEVNDHKFCSLQSESVHQIHAPGLDARGAFLGIGTGQHTCLSKEHPVEFFWHVLQYANNEPMHVESFDKARRFNQVEDERRDAKEHAYTQFSPCCWSLDQALRTKKNLF